MMRTIVWLIVPVLVILLNSCIDNSEIKLEFPSKIFISQPFVNRTIDNGLKHDENCIGFIQDQFDPIDLLSFQEKIKINQLDSLSRIKWKTIETPDSILDFQNVFTSDDDTNRVVFVYEIIRSENDIKKVLSIGSDDGIKIWFNGNLILTDHRGRQLQAHSNLIPVNFRNGYNFILYKVDQGEGNWALYRKIISVYNKNKILYENVTENYGGLPKSSIISDTTRQIKLDIKQNSEIDSLHQVEFKWLDVLSKDPLLPKEEYSAYNLPLYIAIPRALKNWSILEISVLNKKSNSIVFREEIPIAFKSYTDSLALVLTGNNYSKNHKPIFKARKDAVIQLFNLYDAGNEWEYSTRMQLYALLDLYLSVNVSLEQDLTYSGPRNFGYISEIDSSIQPYRLIMPAYLSDRDNAQKSYNLVYCPRWHMRDEMSFWEVYQTRSHSVNIRRTNLSTISHSILIVPYSLAVIDNKGSLIQELNQITDQVRSMLKINSDNISMYMYSSSGGEVLPQLIMDPFPIANIGLMNCILPTDTNIVKNIFDQLNNIYPVLNWCLWHGVQDEEAPVEKTRFLVNHLSSLTNKVSYKEEYYSTHIQYFGDPEKDFLLYVANNN